MKHSVLVTALVVALCAAGAPALLATKLHGSGYDENIAYLNLLLSAAAYSDDPQSCLRGSAATSNFQVTATASTTCDWASDNCFAYTAVSTTNQAVVLAFRGSNSIAQILVEVLETLTVPARNMASGGQVQDYFYDGYEGLQSQVTDAMTSLVSQYPDYDIWITGHSLGGSLASIAAADLAYSGVIKAPIQYTFGEPRTGNAEFAQGHDALTDSSWRVVHYRDIVPHVPFCVSSGGQCQSTGTSYPYHHGIEVFYTEKAMTVGDGSFEICLGDPQNEDASCSDGLVSREPCVDVTTCVCYHTHYFNLDVGGYCSGATDCPCCS